MKKNRIAILIGEIGLVIACAGGFYVFNQQEVQPTEVYTFNKNITTNSQVTENDLKKVTIPASAVGKDFARSPKEIIGKHVGTNVYTGEYVTQPKLVEADNIDPFESMDMSKYRRISLPINLVDGLGGNLKRGDKVDLIYVGEGKKETQNGDGKFLYSKTFLQDVLIESVTTDEGMKHVDKSTLDGSGENSKQSLSGETGEISTITLAVTIGQAEEITTRMKSGQIRIIGRYKDSTNYDSVGYIVGDYEKIYTGSGLAEVNK